MPRKPIAKKPMEPAERRRKSDAAKLALGQRRITTWLSPEASKALDTVLKTEGCDINVALETALLHYIK